MNLSPADQERLLDLLVDGELDEARRRELLLWCDQDPQGWRRCALAFLESQSWSRELGNRLSGGQIEEALAFAPASRDPGAPTPASRQEHLLVRAGESRRPVWKAMIGPLAMAASFLAAFGLGLLARNGWPTGAANSVAGNHVAPNTHFAAQESQAADEWNEGAVAGREPGEPMGQVRLVVDGPDGSPDEIQLPVVEGRSTDADFLRSQPSAVPPEVQRMLEQMGHQVRQRRELLPLRLKDGRRLIVPVDQVEVRPVGNRDYQ